MRHRHLEVPADTPAVALSAAALDDLLDRGDLSDWRPVLRAIAAHPFGPLADTVLRLCDANPRYGTSRLWRSWILRRRDRAGRPPAPATLAHLRRRSSRRQVDVAAQLGISQSDLSKAERRGDMRLSTLRGLVGALGLELRVDAVDPASGETFSLSFGDTE